MKQLLKVMLIFSFISCTEKIVQLPETTNQDITEILDVSPIYMFYIEETDSIEFNRKNMISTTNWLVNIDNRLSLKQILPHLQYLQEKRQGDGMHKNENARNYFTCNNTDLKNLSFIDFTDMVYHTGVSGDYLSKISDLGDSENNIIIKFNSTDEIIIVNHNSESFSTKTNLSKLANTLDQINSQENIIYLNFSQNLNFQDYISIKTQLLKLKSDNVKISNNEFINY
ncbi:MAG: hypothetical protein DA407_07080 [Bacteroidetes bacterium]|nr:MAG: hypothetical protein DA407_07080 [Bacteroidota bacterium]